MKRLTPFEIKTARKEVPNWYRKGGAIQRIFEFNDFAESMKFVNRVARLAEKENHHPEIRVRWNLVTLILTTHSAGGLTARDFQLAEKIDRMK